MKELFFCIAITTLSSASYADSIDMPPVDFRLAHGRVKTGGYELRVDCTEDSCTNVVDLGLPADNIDLVDFQWTHARVSTNGYELRVDCKAYDNKSTCAHVIDLGLPAKNIKSVADVVRSIDDLKLESHFMAILAYHHHAAEPTPSFTIKAYKSYSRPSKVLRVDFVTMAIVTDGYSLGVRSE